jgi:hypothetical protein
MMGEISEMMLDGTLCECCGTFIDSDAGFPQYCSPQCAGDRGAEWFTQPNSPPKRRKKRRKKKAARQGVANG